MHDVIEDDAFDPKKIYDSLIDRCKEVKEWEIRCLVLESFTGWPNSVRDPFAIKIIDGVYYCYPITPTLRDAFILVANTLPVTKFLNYTNE
jgi:hypothetical protein